MGENVTREDPEGKGSKSTVVTVVDIVMNHPWQETSFTKEAYKHLKDYMNLTRGRLEEQRPKRAKPFMTGAEEQTKYILANSPNYQFFIASEMNPDDMAALLDYCEASVTRVYDFLKDGLEMEKC
ncbi:unnamed protein product [Gulo gulo]|uniref:Translationally-controlled tumor protein n=1 Tax=Gulo gulo TaxID=48420 RepID=A0A9X9M4I9_GULGU|nr:unnamed protein product [Gulo gulo]